MDNTYEPDYFFLFELRIRQIAFDEGIDVTIFAGIPDDEDYEKSIPLDLVCDFGLLNDILLFAQDPDQGDLLIQQFSEKLSSKFETPAVIDIENIIGAEMVFSNFILKVYKPHERNEKGDWQPIEDNCVIIDSVLPQSEFDKQKEDRAVHDELLEAAFGHIDYDKRNKEELSDYLILLDNAFKYYLQLCSKDFPKREARKRSGLQDELLFRIATLNHKIISTK
ncbi:MAG TPA: hypothetical protein VL093_12720 [Flavipsychrobacter sp.]|nr:hypothetical protein [Flavipsychrobacter sp.]